MDAPTPHIAVYQSETLPEIITQARARFAFERICAALGMTMFGELGYHHDQKSGVITATQMIAQSNLAYHEERGRGFRLFEVFSCAPFDHERVTGLLGEALEGTWTLVSQWPPDVGDTALYITTVRAGAHS